MLGHGLNINKDIDIDNSIIAQFPGAIAAYNNEEKINNNYTGNCLVCRRTDNSTLEIPFDGNVRDDSILLAFCGVNDGWISTRYDQSGNGNDIIIADTTKQQQIVNAGAIIPLTDKRASYEPFFSSQSLVNELLAINGRMNDLNSVGYILYKDNLNYTIPEYNNDYVCPLNCTAGVMDFSITWGSNVFWYFEDGTESNANNPAPVLGNGISFLFVTNILDNNIVLSSGSTAALFIGNINDFPKLTNSLELYNCSNLLGTLNNGNFANITNYLNLYNCSNITGNLNQVSNVLTYLDLNSCSNIEGDLSDLAPPTTNLICYNLPLVTGNLNDVSNVSNILMLFNTQITGNLNQLNRQLTYLHLVNCNVSGIYDPLNTAINNLSLAGTNMTPNDTDQTLINVANKTLAVGGSFWTAGNRTVASDAAVLTLQGLGWVIA